MKWLSGLAAVALWTCFSSGRDPAPSPPPRPVLSGPVVEERVEYYEVSGTSARELTLAMGRLGPKGRYGPRSAIATTNWQLRWQTDYWSGQGSCAIKSFSTNVKIHIVLPKW